MAKSRGPVELLASGVELLLAPASEASPPRFTMTAYTGGVIRPERPYLDAPLIVELAGVSSPDRIAALLDHDDRQIIGQTDSVRIGKTAITMTGTITGDVAADEEANPSAKVVKHAARGFVWPVSMGATIHRMDYLQPGVFSTVNGQRVEGPLYIARQITVKHISFLSIAADQAATARIAASAQRETDMDFHEWLKTRGFEDPSTLSEAQRTALQKDHVRDEALAATAKKASLPPEDKPKTKPKRANDLAVIKAKRDRDNSLQELAARYGREYPAAIETIEARLEAALADDEWSASDFENLLLREVTRHERVDNRPRGQQEANAIAAPVMEVALCRMGGSPEKGLEARYGAQVMEASRQRFRNGLSLCEFLQIAADANGFRGSFRSDPEDVLAHALPPRFGRGRRDLAAAGPSTYDVADILGNVLNRFVVDYFMGVDQTAMRAISTIRPVTDFRQIESYSLTGDLTFERVAPGGEIKHGTLGNEKYTNQADTYARIIGIDRRDLLNDDVGAFTRVGQRLGRGGALALVHAFWTAFVNNSAFFTTARGNLDEGADTALSIDALTLAKTLFNLLTDPDGKPMNVMPRTLLVPPELEATAKTILNSQLIVVAGNTDVLQGNANVHAGTLGLAMARELSNATYTGHSAKKWYMLAAPTDVPVIETCFLNGVDRPTVEGAQADFDTLGIKMRAFFDFGVALQEYRGGVAMKGEV